MSSLLPQIGAIETHLSVTRTPKEVPGGRYRQVQVAALWCRSEEGSGASAAAGQQRPLCSLTASVFRVECGYEPLLFRL